MKILFIVDETNFYHPKFTYSLYKRFKSKDHIFNVGLVKKIKKTNSIERYLLRNISKLTLREILFLGLKKIYFELFDIFTRNFNIFFKVESVLKKKKITYFVIEYDINNKEYVDYINNLKPDIIISSCSVIFSKNILNVPKFGCINRHTSLLPSYGGLYPVFHSIADKNQSSGVTIHKMTEKKDEGPILAQTTIRNEDNNLSKIYKKGFEASVDLVFDAIKNLVNGKFINNDYKKSYYSFPDEKRWKMFRENKGKFI